jgi:hypothetical protein
MRTGKKEIKQMEWEGMCIEEKTRRFRDAVKVAEELGSM